MDKVQIPAFAAPEGAGYAIEQRLLPAACGRRFGLSPKNEGEALALCVQHGIDKEVATADTLAQLAATFDI